MAQINLPRIRVTCNAPGTGTFSSLTRSYGSYGIAELITKGWIVVGDTVDYSASNGEQFEEGIGTIDASGNIVRTTIKRARHTAGTIDTIVVTFAGIVSIVVTFGTWRVADLVTLAAKAIRADQAQSLSAPEQAQARANAPPFASTTEVTFHQSTAPVGWTKQTTHTDKALRVTSGTISSGGSVDFSTCFARTATDNFTLTAAETPAHTHSGTTGIDSVDHNHNYTTGNSFVGTFTGGGSNGWAGQVTTQTSGIGAQAHTHNYTTSSVGSSGAHGHGMDIRVKYVDLIIAAKD